MSKETLESLDTYFTYLTFIQNPVDLFIEASPKDYDVALRGCLKDKNVDGVVIIHTPSYLPNSREIAEAVVEAAKAYPYKPVFTVWMGGEQVMLDREFLSSRGIPTFVSTEQSVKSFMYMYRYDYNLRLLLETRLENGHRLWAVDLGDRLSLPVAAGRLPWAAVAKGAEPTEFVLGVPDGGGALVALDAYDRSRLASYEADREDMLLTPPLILGDGRIAVGRSGYSGGGTSLVVLRMDPEPETAKSGPN